MEIVNRPITVADLDPITPVYHVVDEFDRSIGEKKETRFFMFNRDPDEKFVYLKPEYTKTGQRVGGKRSGPEARFYRTTPPWLKYEVFKIDRLGGHITLHTRK